LMNLQPPISAFLYQQVYPQRQTPPFLPFPFLGERGPLMAVFLLPTSHLLRTLPFLSPYSSSPLFSRTFSSSHLRISFRGFSQSGSLGYPSFLRNRRRLSFFFLINLCKRRFPRYVSVFSFFFALNDIGISIPYKDFSRVVFCPVRCYFDRLCFCDGADFSGHPSPSPPSRSPRFLSLVGSVNFLCVLRDAMPLVLIFSPQWYSLPPRPNGCCRLSSTFTSVSPTSRCVQRAVSEFPGNNTALWSEVQFPRDGSTSTTIPLAPPFYLLQIRGSSIA